MPLTGQAGEFLLCFAKSMALPVLKFWKGLTVLIAPQARFVYGFTLYTCGTLMAH